MYQHLMNHATGRGHGISIFLSNSQNEYKVRYTTYNIHTYYILCKVVEGLGTMQLIDYKPWLQIDTWFSD